MPPRSTSRPTVRLSNGLIRTTAPHNTRCGIHECDRHRLHWPDLGQHTEVKIRNAVQQPQALNDNHHAIRPNWPRMAEAFQPNQVIETIGGRACALLKALPAPC